ncbi:MAG: DUF1573 domain-containing protein [Candidatus Cryptobacteroides sp.]
MKHLLYILILAAMSFASMQEAAAQIKLVPKEKLDSIANPALSPEAGCLKFDKTALTLPTMSEQDPPARMFFLMTNVSDKELRLTSLTTSCSCVKASSDRLALKPGESAEIKVTYYPKGHLGTFTHRVNIFTGGFKEPSALLKVTVHVENN